MISIGASDPGMLALALLGGHALADFGIQSAYVSSVKSRHEPHEMDPGNEHWFWVLAAHALMHGAVVGLVTGHAWMGFGEVVLHFIIDDVKAAKRIGYNQDQILHYACKALWFVLTLWLA